MRTWDPTGRPKRKGGRPLGRKNSIAYGSGVARQALALRLPRDPAVKAIGKEAQRVIRKAFASGSPDAFRKPPVLAAIYLLQTIGRKASSVLDLLDDIETA